MKKTIAWLAIMAIFLNSVALLWIAQVTDAGAAGWIGDKWAFRKKITISGNAADITDYQYQITAIDTKALYDSKRLQANCEDLRFTSAEGILLDFWVEDDGVSCKDDTTTDIWVKLPKAYSTGTIIYMYYGNDTALGYASGSKTFGFFDDFSESVAAWYNPN